MDKKNNVYDIVVDKVIQKMKDEKRLPWERPFSKGGYNYITKRRYSGINRLLLGGGEFLTFKQLQDYNKKHNTHFFIEKGCKAYIAVFYDSKHKQVSEEQKKDLLKEAIPSELINKRIVRKEDEFYIVSSTLKYYKLFSINNIINDKGEKLPSDLKLLDEFNSDTKSDCVVSEYTAKTGVSVYNDTSGRAYYSLKEDAIHTPPQNNFKCEEAYYRTVFHEMVHSTGIITRLNRSSLYNYRDGERSKEEIIAEFGALLLATECGFNNDSYFDNSVAYIESWAKWMKDNAAATVCAFSAAEKAVNFILNKEDKNG